MEDEKVVEIIEEGEGQRCLGCALYLPLEKFGKMSKKKNGKNPRCFECQRELSSTRREKYKDKIRERSRAYNKKKYEKIKQVQEEHQELTARDQEIKNNEEKMYRLEQRVRELEFENEYLKSMLEKENISGLVSL